MVEILELVLEFFKVQDYAHSVSQNPLEQLLFGIFFPSVILILFIEVLTTSALRTEGKKLSTLLSVAFYIFILVYPPGSTYSLYSMFAPILGTLWYIFFILIGFMFFLFNRIFPRDSTGVRAESRLLSQGKDMALEMMRTSEEVKRADAQIEAVKARIAELKSEGASSDIRAKQEEELSHLIREKAALQDELRIQKQIKKRARF